jgi:hypothetical protein
MTKSFLFSCCFLIATASALAQQFPMDPFMGVNLRREDPIERLKCVGFVREYRDWAVDEGNAYGYPDSLSRYRDSFAYPRNRYAWNLRQSTSVKFDDFYDEMLRNLNHTANQGNRPPICATMKQCLPYLAGGDTYGTYSEIKPVRYRDLTNRLKGNGFPQTDASLPSNPHEAWDSPNNYQAIADWLAHFTRRYGANDTCSIPAKLNPAESESKGRNQVGYIELWNEPNKYWIGNQGDSSWLKATQFTGAEYAAMASAAYDGHNRTITNKNVFDVGYYAGIKRADSTMKFVMGGSAGIREYDWRFLRDMTTWFDNHRANTAKKYPFDVINFHHYNSNRWFGIGGSGTESLTDYAVSPEADRWRLGSLNVNYAAATTDPGSGNELEQAIPYYTGRGSIDSTNRTFKQRLVELRHRVKRLMGHHPFELWMSEFGFDTNEKSPYKVPALYSNGVLVADQQEVQARFIVRTYLEIASANWDRAMQYDFRDEKSHDGSLFQASGLLKDRENNYAPKKSYYYVYTMKEALKGAKFTNEIKVADDPTFVDIATDTFFGGHSYWYQDTMYPRISRFATTNPNAMRLGDIVYVTWLPTKINAERSNIKIYLEPTDVAATKATLVECAAGDINGVRKALRVQSDGAGKYILVPKITEVPLFIRFGDSISDVTPAKPRVDAGNTLGISCDAIRVKLSTNMPTNGHLRVYYYERRASEWSNVPNKVDLNDKYTRLYSDSISINDFIVSKLKLSHNPYMIYVQVVDSNSNVAELDSAIFVKTTDCFNNFIPKNWIPSTLSSRELNQLFDYTNLDFCYPLRTKKAPDGNYTYEYLGQWQADTGLVKIVEFNENYLLDAVSILGGTGAGLVTIEYWNGTVYKPWIHYLKDGFDEWKTFIGLTESTQKLRLTKGTNMGIRKIVLKGRPQRDPPFKIECCGENDVVTYGNSVVRVTKSKPQLSRIFPDSSSYTGVLRIEDTSLIMDKAFTFGVGTKIYMQGAKAALVLDPNQTLFNQINIESTNIRGCDVMWKGIFIYPQANLKMSNSAIRDAEVGLTIVRNTDRTPLGVKTIFKVDNTVFEENLGGFSTKGEGGFVSEPTDIYPESDLKSCVFDGNFRDLKLYTLDTRYKQSLTGLDLYQTSVSLGGARTDVPNVFNDLAVGINLNNASPTIANCIFKNIQSKRVPNQTSTSRGLMESYGGNAVNAFNAYLSFKGKGIGEKDPAIFEKVQNGFYGYYTDFSISDGKFTTEGDYGVQTHYDHGSGSTFTGCHFTALNGAGFTLWKGGQSVTLLNNFVDCGTTRRSMDAVGIGSYFHSNATLEVEIHTNTIRGANAPRAAILSLGTLNNVMVRQNILKFNSYETTDANPAWGIKMNLLENSTIKRNEILGIPNAQNNYMYSPGQVGILSSNSRNNYIYCDSIKNAKIGMQFQYNNMTGVNGFGTIAGNRLSGYNIGVKVDSFALIGTQAHRRNIWRSPNADPYQLDAVLEDTTPARKANNRFVVENAFKPNRLSPSTEWFQDVNNPSSGSIFDCSFFLSKK